MSTPVATTSAGISTDANTWTKIATINFGSTNFQDFSLILGFAAASGHPQTAIVEFTGRQTTSTSTSPTDMYATVLSIGGGSIFSESSFRVINTGYAANFEIWIEKVNSFGQINVFELSSFITGSTTVTYLSNQGWGAMPTGTPAAISYINGQYLNVKDLGAKGDGVTYDDTSIQTALNNASLYKRNLFFPPGTYLLNNKITKLPYELSRHVHTLS